MSSSIIIQGLIFSLVAMAVYLTSRVINKDDLSVEGSFGLGGALTALMLEHNFPALITLGATITAGAAAGLCTGLLYTRLKMNHLMAGLTTTTACFSLALGLASANKLVSAPATIFSKLAFMSDVTAEIGISLAVALVTLLMIRLLLHTEVGLLLRAVGDNPALLATLGKSSAWYYTLCFVLANACTALAGSLFVQWSGFFSITGSMGTLITGLASLMLAELFSKKLGLVILLASLGYQAILASSLALGISPVWNNLVKALVMMMLVLLSQHLKKSISQRGSHA